MNVRINHYVCRSNSPFHKFYYGLMCDISDRNNSKRLERRNVLKYFYFYRVNSRVVLLRDKKMFESFPARSRIINFSILEINMFFLSKRIFPRGYNDQTNFPCLLGATKASVIWFLSMIQIRIPYKILSLYD